MGSQGGYGGKGAGTAIPHSKYSRGGDGGNGGRSTKHGACSGGQGGAGGNVAVYTLSAELHNASCTLTVGQGGAGGQGSSCAHYRPGDNSYPGENGGDGSPGVCIIEW